MEYIFIEKGIITSHMCGSEPPPNAVLIPDNATVIVGDRVACYTSGWQRKGEAELIREGLVPMPAGYTWMDEEKNAIREMADIEKMEAGLEPIPQGMRLENGGLIQLSNDEQFELGLITQSEYKKRKRSRLMSELDDIDRKTTRPLRAILSGLGTDEDERILKNLESQAAEKRKEIASLQ